MKRVVGVCALLLLIAGSPTAFGGEAAHYDAAGQPVLWDPSLPVPYRVDRGSLGGLSNVQAVALVRDLIGVWEAVPTSTLRFERLGSTAEDVDRSNFARYLGAFSGQTTPAGENVVAFDSSGEVFDALFGVGTGIVGFANTTWVDDGSGPIPLSGTAPAGARMVEAAVFLNGRFIDGAQAPNDDNFEISRPAFEAAVVHELGHFAGLGHTQVRGLAYPPFSDLPGLTGPVETMFPYIQPNGSQTTLERDDVVTLSRLYPTADFLASTGCAEGSITTFDGEPQPGINVIATHRDEPDDALSTVSLGADGRFRLCGLRPSAPYTLHIGEIDAFHAGGSRVGPYSPPRILPGPAEAWSGDDEGFHEAFDTAEVFSVQAGGLRPELDFMVEAQAWAVINQELSGQVGPLDVAHGDFDGDGTLDLVGGRTGAIGGETGNDVVFYRGLGGGLFDRPRTVAPFPGVSQVEAIHLNPQVDRFLDFAAASDSQGTVRGFLGDGRGGFSTGVVLFQLDLENFASEVTLAAGRVDGDNLDDLVLLARYSDAAAGLEVDTSVISLLNDGAGSFPPTVNVLPSASRLAGMSHRRLLLGDFTGEGRADLVFIGDPGVREGDGPALWLMAGDGVGGFGWNRVALGAIAEKLGRGLAAADFDQDGRLDLAVISLAAPGAPPNFTRSWIELLRGSGDGSFEPMARYWVPESSQDALVSGDFDGDGHADVASAGAFYGPGRPGARLTVAYGDGAGGIRGREVVSGLAEFPGATPSALAAADLDADGRLDLLSSSGALPGQAEDHRPRWTSVLRRPTGCEPSPRHLCLSDRFRAEVVWQDFEGRRGGGRAVPITADTGSFWFFGQNHHELAVKVVDGRSDNGFYWVFFGSLSNVAFTLTVTDTFTGAVRSYHNPGRTFASRGDTRAFRGGGEVVSPATPEPSTVAPTPSLALSGGRFDVRVEWTDFSGRQGLGQAVPMTDKTGYFWFFDDSNVELLVKILDGRSDNGHFWVFYGSLSNVAFTLRVLDTETGVERVYENPSRTFASRGDTAALPAP
ncbi:MAG: FG-GAP-like repeat-containing protein [Acidobacteriota bacterium]